ncbi:MAG: acyl-CoA carboxylase subunit beta [Candidatus Binatia bacterium]
MREEHLRRLQKLAAAKALATEMGGAEAVAKQHARGKLTCRERLDLLLDPGSFVELGILAQSVVEVPGKTPKVARAAGVLVGAGTIDGRRVFVSADDATVVSGARGASGWRKSEQVQRMALQQRFPMISLMEASAGRIQDQMGSRKWAGLNFDPHTTGFGHVVDLSGVIPQVTAAMGNSVGGAAFIAMLSDFVPMVQPTSFMAVAGPPVVLGAVGETASREELGSSQLHCALTGQADYEAKDDADCLHVIREYLSYFPSSCYELPPRRPTEDSPDRSCDELLDIVPTNLRKPYDIYAVIRSLVDEGQYLAVKRDYGQGVATCLARLNGHVVGIIGSQPLHMAGVLDDTATYKIIHFMELCDAFHIPLLFLVDCPGFMIGKEWERRSMLKWVARALHAHRRVTVPKITMVLRKAYGLAYWILGGKAMLPDAIAAWPTASLSLMAAEPAVNVIYGQEIKTAADPEAERTRYMELFAQEYAPEGAAEEFTIDDIIDPRQTRAFLCRMLEVVLASRNYRVGFKHAIYP